MSHERSVSFDLPFLLIAIGLILFGLIMLNSASGPTGYENFHDSFYFVKHQLLFGLVPGIIGMIFFARLPYQRLKKWATPALAVSILLLLSVFIPGVGFGTSHSWVRFGSLGSIQPAEIVKLTFLIYLAAWLEERQQHMGKVKEGLVPFLIATGLVLGLIVLQPDVGTMSVIAAMAFTVYFVAGAPLTQLAAMAASGVGIMLLLINLAPYRAARFMTFLHPELDPKGIGYHINQALLAIGSGGFFGLGYGLSRQKYAYLPEVVDDSIFAVIAEEMGFVICIAFVALFVAFVWRGTKIATQAKDPFGRFLVAGVIAWLGVQAFINVGSMLSIMPMTGVTLPFVSYGGTSLAVSMCAVGLVLSVSRGAKGGRV